MLQRDLVDLLLGQGAALKQQENQKDTQSVEKSGSRPHRDESAGIGPEFSEGWGMHRSPLVLIIRFNGQEARLEGREHGSGQEESGRIKSGFQLTVPFSTGES